MLKFILGPGDSTNLIAYTKLLPNAVWQILRKALIAECGVISHAAARLRNDGWDTSHQDISQIVRSLGKELEHKRILRDAYSEKLDAAARLSHTRAVARKGMQPLKVRSEDRKAIFARRMQRV
jgi:hypothetical protein